MYDVVTFGEAMIRLSPPNFQRLEQTRTLDLNVAGAEFNVAAGVTRFGLHSAWVSRLPENPLGYAIRNRAREFGVDCRHVVWVDEGRAGIYFLDFGTAPRVTSVLYDRQRSAMSMIQPGEIDWRSLFGQARHFHVTGITPALSRTAAEATEEALKEAREARCTISYDLNFRRKLWDPAAAKQVQEPLLQYVDVLITNEEDPRLIFGIEEESAERAAAKLAETYACRVVAVTQKRSPSPRRHHWTAVACEDGRTYGDRTYELEVVDRVGAGDSFAAGFIAGWQEDRNVRQGLRFGNAFAALKHTFPGDMNWSTRQEVEALLAGTERTIAR